MTGLAKAVDTPIDERLKNPWSAMTGLAKAGLFAVFIKDLWLKPLAS